MGLVIRVHNINFENDFYIKYKESETIDDEINGFIDYNGIYSKDTDVIILSGISINYNTNYWLKLIDSKTGEYVIKNIITDDSKTFKQYNEINFRVEINNGVVEVYDNTNGNENSIINNVKNTFYVYSGLTADSYIHGSTKLLGTTYNIDNSKKIFHFYPQSTNDFFVFLVHSDGFNPNAKKQGSFNLRKVNLNNFIYQITPTPTKTLTQTPTRTSTNTPTPTFGVLPTPTMTSTQTPTPTRTSTQTPTRTLTQTPTSTTTPNLSSLFKSYFVFNQKYNSQPLPTSGDYGNDYLKVAFFSHGITRNITTSDVNSICKFEYEILNSNNEVILTCKDNYGGFHPNFANDVNAESYYRVWTPTHPEYSYYQWVRDFFNNFTSITPYTNIAPTQPDQPFFNALDRGNNHYSIYSKYLPINDSYAIKIKNTGTFSFQLRAGTNDEFENSTLADVYTTIPPDNNYYIFALPKLRYNNNQDGSTKSYKLNCYNY